MCVAFLAVSMVGNVLTGIMLFCYRLFWPLAAVAIQRDIEHAGSIAALAYVGV